MGSYSYFCVVDNQSKQREPLAQLFQINDGVTSKGLFYAPALKDDVADTVGCGDSFAVAIVVGYINLMPIITTLVLENVVGGATAMGCGAGRNVATKEKICELLLASEVNNDYEDFWRRIRDPEYFEL